MFSQSKNLPLDVIGIILSFLGKDIYFNKHMKQFHIRFNRMNENVILNNLFLNMHYSFESFFQLNDSNEISSDTRTHSSMTIYINEFRKNLCYPQNLIFELDASIYCIMQLIDNIYKDDKCIHESYTYFPVLKKQSGMDPKIKSRFLYF
jgi:hypothetical protein